MKDLSLHKNNKGNTLVSIDGNLYIFSIPSEYYIRQLFHIMDVPFYDYVAVSEVTVGFQKDAFHGISTIAKERSDWEPESKIYFSCSNNNEYPQIVSTYLHVRPMLIPVLADGVTFDASLQVNPNGSILHGCSLYCAENCCYQSHSDIAQYYPVTKKALNERPLPEFSKGVTISDTGDDLNEQLEWVCINGCLVSRKCLFIARPDELYGLGLWFPPPQEAPVQ